MQLSTQSLPNEKETKKNKDKNNGKKGIGNMKRKDSHLPQQ